MKQSENRFYREVEPVAEHHLPVIHSTGFSFAEMERMAESIARSRLFGVQNADQALSLMLISQAEGRHPALASRDYDIIQGRPAKKAEAMQRDFMAAGGKIEWHKLSDTEADATFSHPSGGAIRIDWDMARAGKAGLGGKDMWKKYPRQMLKARVVSEGVRTIFPAATSGMYVPEEVDDFREPIDVTPPKETVTAQVDEWRNEREGLQTEPQFLDVGLDIDKLIAQGNAICADAELLKLWWTTHLSAAQRGELGVKGRGVGPYLPGWKEGQKQTKQASATPTPEAPPAGDGTVPHEASPQAEDVFGLPKDDDEAFCAGVLAEVRACNCIDDIDEIRFRWNEGGLWYARINRLPADEWAKLMAAIGEHEDSVRRVT